MMANELLIEYSQFLREKKAEGKKVIAYMSHDNTPEEIIDAAGFVPLNLIFSGNDELMNASHDYLPPSTCSFAQSCIGLFSQKPSKFSFLDLIDYIIVSNHCVSNICAAEIISKYFSIPRINHYIPYAIDQNTAKYYKIELEDFKNQIERIKESQISDDSIFNSIKRYNKFKKEMNQLNHSKLNGKKKLEFLQKALLFGPDYLSELKAENLSNISKGAGHNENNTKGIILTGCSIFIGDYLIDLIEEGGGNVVVFDSWIGNNYFGQTFEEELFEEFEDPLDFLVYRFKKNKFSDHSIPHFLDNKTSQLLDYVKQYKRKEGKDVSVINHIIKFCDHISIMSSFLKKKLQENGIKILNLERDYSRANRGQLSTRIEAFLEMV